MLLAGDVGGTKTNLAIFSTEQGEGEARKPVAQKVFPSGQYPSLEALVQEFLDSVHVSIERASFGVAGPVVNRQATITNLPWMMDEQQLQETLHIPTVRLLNDLEAIAHAIPFLQPTDLHTLNEGQRVSHGPLAVIAPGTGLGEAYLTWEGARYHAHTSEGGHTDFAPLNALQIDLLRYLLDRYDHISYERVCSGIGIPNLYAYLKNSGYAPEPPWLAKQLAAADDPTRVIFAAALAQENPSELCSATLNLFVAILGAEAGNLALKVLATGGVFIGGGIPPRILPLLEHGRFIQAFTHKGRFDEILSRMPVQVILNSEVALLGAAYHGLEIHPD
ncbi:MAG TPA: glucokinase [Ktedonobacteraceae bacterium]|nr:glucokinase [Ktedonobacteraceae bacterium]